MFNSMLNNATPEKVGTIKAYGGATAPVGWLVCDGSAISRELYAELFGVIGTTYGAGDGSTTFNIPNGVAPIGTTAPAKGNNLTIGLTNGASNGGILKQTTNGWQLLQGSAGAYNKNVGVVLTESLAWNIPDNQIVGLTSDPDKSGIICDLTLASAASTAIIKY